jgi:hypothetical protein
VLILLSAEGGLHITERHTFGNVPKEIFGNRGTATRVREGRDQCDGWLARIHLEDSPIPLRISKNWQKDASQVGILTGA